MKKILLWSEMAIVYTGVPVVLWCYPGPRLLVLAIWAVCGVCLIYLLRGRSFDRRLLHAWAAANWTALFCRGAVIIGLLAVYTVVFEPQHFARLVREDTARWALLMLLYPVLSVLPQELIYRAFFFHRYRALFASERSMVLANAAFFAFGHIIFRNGAAVAVSFAVGLLWAGTYLRSRSLPAVTIEHALYGNLAFTLGLGDNLLVL